MHQMTPEEQDIQTRTKSLLDALLHLDEELATTHGRKVLSCPAH